MKIKYDQDTIKIMNLFERVTRARLKDFFEKDNMNYFIVYKEDIGKAIGKQASNAKKITVMLKKPIKIIAYSEDLKEFIQNTIHPLKISNIEENETKKIITLTAIDSKTRGLLIGRNASNLRNYEVIIKRYFDIDELKVN